MAYNRGRKQVTWKDPVAHVAKKRPHPHVLAPSGDVCVRHVRPEDLTPGSLWVVVSKCGPNNTYNPDVYEQHEFPYLTVLYYAGADNPGVPINSVAVYLGHTRVEEESRAGVMLSIPRHTFLINGKRWLVADFNLLEPISTGV